MGSVRSFGFKRLFPCRYFCQKPKGLTGEYIRLDMRYDVYAYTWKLHLTVPAISRWSSHRRQANGFDGEVLAIKIITVRSRIRTGYRHHFEFWAVRDHSKYVPAGKRLDKRPISCLVEKLHWRNHNQPINYWVVRMCPVYIGLHWAASTHRLIILNQLNTTAHWNIDHRCLIKFKTDKSRHVHHLNWKCDNKLSFLECSMLWDRKLSLKSYMSN